MASKKQLHVQDYTVGWIAALPHELRAARYMIDEVHASPKGFTPVRGNILPYEFGNIGRHNVAFIIADRVERDVPGCTPLCFEMEAAGLMNEFPGIVIRGICDYADGAKNDVWHKYTALVAAAYAKELLTAVEPQVIMEHPAASELLESVQRIESIIKQDYSDQKSLKIYEWLSPLNTSTRHVDSKEKRVKDTGLWLLEDPKFKGWVSGVAQRRTLGCYGPAGAGKTIISSLVIDELEKQVDVKGSRLGLAYVYCDYRDQAGQTIENIFGAMIKQLIMRLPKIPEALAKLYEEQKSRDEPLRSTDAVDLLQTIFTKFSKVYVCLDALDEVRNLRGLLKTLRESLTYVQIFFTGHHHVQSTVQEYFKEENFISIEARESDIRLFIEHEIGGANDLEPRAMNDKLRERISNEVIKSAEGVFLLPTLQIRAVLQETTIRDRNEVLDQLPSSLDEAFAGSMIRIEQQPESQYNKAAKIIAWIHLAERPLTVDELQCCLATRDGDRLFDREGIPTRESMLNCCQGLAVIDHETSTVRLVHYSLQQYLSRQDNIFGCDKAAWQSKIARTCLTFLQFPSSEAESGREENSGTATLLFYAAIQWGHHLRRSNASPDSPIELAKAYLLRDLTKTPEHLRLLYDAMYQYHDVKKLYNGLLPAYIIAFFGSVGLMSHLISAGKVDMDSKDSEGQTPLSWAVGNGHEAIVKLLLDTGKVDADSKDSGG